MSSTMKQSVLLTGEYCPPLPHAVGIIGHIGSGPDSMPSGTKPVSELIMTWFTEVMDCTYKKVM